jgi:hypothetical protein
MASCPPSKDTGNLHTICQHEDVIRWSECSPWHSCRSRLILGLEILKAGDRLGGRVHDILLKEQVEK